MKKTYLLLCISLCYPLFSSAEENFLFEKNNNIAREIDINKNNSSISSVIINSVQKDDDILFTQDEPVHVNPLSFWDNIVQTKNKNYELIEDRLAKGQNINQSIIEGNTLLHLAAMQSNERLFNIGLTYQANIMAKNKNGDTPLHWAAHQKNANILNSLLVNSKSLKVKNYINLENKLGKTPLHFSVMTKDNAGQINILIQNQANINSFDKNKQTPAHYAANLKNWTNLIVLLENGADISIKDNNNVSVSEIISENMNPNIIGLKKYLKQSQKEVVDLKFSKLGL